MVPTVDQTLRAFAGLAVERLALLEKVAALEAENARLSGEVANLTALTDVLRTPSRNGCVEFEPHPAVEDVG